MEQDNRTSTEIDLRIDEIEKEVKVLFLHRGTVQDEYNKLRRQEIELMQQKLEITKKKQDIKIELDKAKSIVDDMEREIKLERRRFWSARNSGH